jgi:hypothetical protein
MRNKIVAFRSMIIAFCAITAALVYLGGCGGGGSASTGTLKLSITDRQSDDFQSVVLAISEIRVVPNGHEGSNDSAPGLPVLVKFDTPKVVDVMQLQFLQETLGQAVLPAGRYSQIRLILAANPGGNQAPVNYLTLKTDPDTRIAIATPSGQQSGLKVLGPVEVNPGVINAVMIDFDPNTAIVKNRIGNSDHYNFKPTGIRLIQMADVLNRFGSIVGNVSTAFQQWSSATVSIKRRGTINDTDPVAAGRIFATYTSGKWQAPFSAFVPASGTGWGYKTFISSNGFAIYSSSAYPVAVDQATDLGEIVLTPQ